MTDRRDVSPRALALVALGAAVGAAARYLITDALPTGFPWGTVVVNLAGSFLLGLLIFGGLAKGHLPAGSRLLVGVGLLGGFTTMSAFALDTLTLLEQGAATEALLAVALNGGASLVALAAGRILGVALPERRRPHA